MEVVVNQSFQTARRAGKRFIVSKVNSSTREKQQQQQKPQQQQQSHTQQLAQNLYFYIPSFPSVPKHHILQHRTFFPPRVSSLSCLFDSRQTTDQTSAAYSLLNKQNCRCVHTLSNVSLLNPSKVEDSLEKNCVPYKKGYTGFLTKCSKCDASKTENNENCSGNDRSGYSVFIDSRTGQAMCRSCGVKQDWKTFSESFHGREMTCTPTEDTNVISLVKDSPEKHSFWKNSEPISDDGNTRDTLLDGISLGVLQKFRVRKTPDNLLVFPYYDITKNCLVELKAYDSDGLELANVNNGESSVLFGWHTITKSDTKVVLTSSELDSIVVTQLTGLPSLAIAKSSFSSEVFPFLEQFTEIFLWFRDDYREQENLQTFAKKLDFHRCWKVSASKTPRLMLKQDGALAVVGKLNSGAHRMSHDYILTYKDLQTELYHHLINAKKNAGVPFTRFPVLNEYLKGHRRGELTVFTGPTGSGKTTFLSELSLDLCMQGVKTLWGSFEIKNLRLLNTLMHQFTGFALENHIDRFVTWSEQFERLPLYFMNYYGAQNLNDVIRTIEYAVYTYNIEHVVIDNLQFMITALGNSDDKFQVMDRAISAFRKCASDNNIHVTVVVHPRKENDGGSLQTASIYGSAKASQEADNVLILQTSDQLSMQVTKNRFCGTIGLLPLSFHPESLCLSGFHRNVETGEAILPQLRVRRPVRNVQILRKNQKE